MRARAPTATARGSPLAVGRRLHGRDLPGRRRARRGLRRGSKSVRHGARGGGELVGATALGREAREQGLRAGC